MITNETKTQIQTVDQLDKAFTTLINEREVWEAGTYAASNTELYALLGHCLDVLYKLKRFTELARGLNGLLETRGFKFTAGTSIEVRLLRAVFGDATDAKKYKHRIYSYARVLTVAHGLGIKGDGIADFIVKSGGIDEIRRHDPQAQKKSDDDKARKQLAEVKLADKAFTAIATGITVTPELEPASDQYFSVALVRKESDGTASIVFGSDNPSLVNSLLGIAGRQIDADAEDARKRKRQQEIAASNASAIADVAAEITEVVQNTPQPQQPTVSAPVTS